jgi:hypothetical protein
MPLRKNNPNDRMAAQTPPHRTGTADSGYYGNGQDEDATQRQPGMAERTWDFNGPLPHRQSVLDVNNRRTAEATEESRRQLAGNVRFQRERQAELQRAMDQRDLAERDAAERRIEYEEERQAIAASARVAQEEANQRQEDLDLAIAMANSAAEAEESDRQRAIEAALEADGARLQREAQEASSLRAAEAAWETERFRLEREAEDRQIAADLQAIEAAETSLRRKAEEERRQARAARAIEAAHESERQRPRREAAHALLQQQAEENLRRDRVTKAAEAAKKRQAEAEQTRASEQRAIEEAAAVLERDEQQNLDLALALSLGEVDGVDEEVEVDSRPQHAHPTSESGIALQLLQVFKRLQDSVGQREAAAILASEQQDEAPPIARVGDQADIGFQRTQLHSCSQDDDDTEELFFDAPESATLVDHNVVQRHLAKAGEDWSDRAVMNSPLLAPMPRQIPSSARLEHPVQPSSATVNEENTRLTRLCLPELSLRGPGSAYYEPYKPYRQPDLFSASPPHLDQAPTTNTAGRVFTNNSSINQPINIYGDVTINNHINISVPVEKSRNFLKRVLSQSMNKARGKTSGMVAVTSAAREHTASLIRSGVENTIDNLNIWGNRYVMNADRSLRMIDEAYETPSRTGSPSPDPSLIANLEAVQERLRTPSAQSVHQTPFDDNGSPVSLPPQPLRVVNTSSTPSPLTPVSTGARPAASSRSSSSLHASPLPSNGARSTQESGSEGSEFKDSGVGISDVHQSPTGAAPSPHRPTVIIPPHGAPVTRKPIPDHFNRPSRNPVAPTREPSADSMRAQNDSPSYMQRVLGRKRIHPPVNTEWANVPATTQDLEFTNSHAMMGVNRFDDSRHEMPILPQRTGDATAPTVDRTITPNTKTRKTEKDAQKRLRGLM